MIQNNIIYNDMYNDIYIHSVVTIKKHLVIIIVPSGNLT